MTQGRDGFSLAHRAALIVAALAAVVVMTSISYALDDPVIVTNQGGLLAGTIVTFNANDHKTMNQRPNALINAATVAVTVAPGTTITLPVADVITGVRVNPTNGPGLTNATYVFSDLSVLGAANPDIMAFFAAGATGTGAAAAGGTFTLSLPTMPPTPIVQLKLPQDVAFALTAFSTGPIGTAVGVGDLFVSNYTGGETGSVIHFPANVGTSTNPLGLIANPFPPHMPAAIPSLVLEDSKLSASNPFGCPTGVSTSLLGPVGVALDASNHIWVANSGFRGSFPSYITEYPPGAFGCTPPIGLVGLGTLVSAGYLAIDPDGNLWVTDLSQNAVFEFSATGTVLTTIKGNKTGLRSPMGLALGNVSTAEPVPNVYVANALGGNILEYEDADDGGLLNVKTSFRIQGGKTKINQPVGVAVIP